MSLRYKLTADRSIKINLCLTRAIRLVSGVSKYTPMNTDDKVSFVLVQPDMVQISRRKQTTGFWLS